MTFKDGTQVIIKKVEVGTDGYTGGGDMELKIVQDLMNNNYPCSQLDNGDYQWVKKMR